MKAIYHQSTHSLEEQPEMKEPPHYLFAPNYSAKDYFNLMDKYNEQKALCKTYPVSGTVPEYWLKGEVLEEGRDYRIEDTGALITAPKVAVPMKENKEEEVKWGQELFDKQLQSEFKVEEEVDYCTCPDFGYYVLGEKRCCIRCNREKPDSYEPRFDAFFNCNNLVASQSNILVEEEVVKEDETKIGENEYLDFSKMEVTEEVKAEFINLVTAGCAKELLKTFLGCGLNTHIEQMIIDEVSGKEFILTFQTLETFKSRFLSLPSAPIKKDLEEVNESQDETIARNPDTLYTYYQVELKDSSQEFDTTICESLGEVLQILTLVDIDLDDDTRKTKVIITGVPMTAAAFEDWKKEFL